jgi:hypothetical protein
VDTRLKGELRAVAQYEFASRLACALSPMSRSGS